MRSISKYVFLAFGVVLFSAGIFVIFQQKLGSSQFYSYLSLVAFGISGFLAYFLILGIEKCEKLENTIQKLRSEVFVMTDH